MVPVKPALSEEEMERKSKSIIDEFLHINDFKVCLVIFPALLLWSEASFAFFFFFFFLIKLRIFVLVLVFTMIVS